MKVFQLYDSRAEFFKRKSKKLPCGKLATVKASVWDSDCEISGDALPDRRSVAARQPHWKETLCCFAKRNQFIKLIEQVSLPAVAMELLLETGSADPLMLTLACCMAVPASAHKIPAPWLHGPAKTIRDDIAFAPTSSNSIEIG